MAKRRVGLRYLKSMIVDYELPIPRGHEGEEIRWIQDIGGLLGARWPVETWGLWRYIGEDGGAVHVGGYVKYQERHMIYPGTLRVRGVLPRLWATKDMKGYVIQTQRAKGWGVVGYRSNFLRGIEGRGARKKCLRRLILHGNQGMRIPRYLPTQVEPPVIDPAGMKMAWEGVRRGTPEEPTGWREMLRGTPLGPLLDIENWIMGMVLVGIGIRLGQYGG